MVIAYLRVSTEKQFLQNQKEEIRRFARSRNIHIDKWYTEVVSGRTCSRDRKLHRILRGMKEGDVLVVTEISRLSRTMLEVMDILNVCIQKDVILYSTKEGYAFENNLNSKVLGFAFGLVAEIERSLISMRTKEALARLKAEGKHLGRPFGSLSRQTTLFQNREVILHMKEKGCTHSHIARKYGVSVRTVCRFFKNLREEAAGTIPG